MHRSNPMSALLQSAVRMMLVSRVDLTAQCTQNIAHVCTDECSTPSCAGLGACPRCLAERLPPLKAALGAVREVGGEGGNSRKVDR